MRSVRQWLLDSESPAMKSPSWSQWLGLLLRAADRFVAGKFAGSTSTVGRGLPTNNAIAALVSRHH
jgi:hypothetical protein